MAIEKKLIKDAHELNIALHENTAQYLHSTPVILADHYLALSQQATRHAYKIVYDIKDPCFIAAITQSSILMTGGTDIGKTTLAKLAQNAFFGKEEEGWHRIDVDIDFSQDMYADKDFSVITAGKKLSEGFYTAQGFLGLPGLIVDEINRTHGKIGNKLIHIFDRDVSLPDGKRVKVGFPINDESTYQLQIAAINEGDEYTGTFQLDKAMRRRTILEIPMDVFPMTDEDKMHNRHWMEEGRKIELRNTENRLATIVRLYQQLHTLPTHFVADLFHGYVESLDYCLYSETKTKAGIKTRSGTIEHICNQPPHAHGTTPAVACPYLRSFELNMCPNVNAITPGVSRNLSAVARGFAVLRTTKFVELLASYLVGHSSAPLCYEIAHPERFTESLRTYTNTQLTGRDLARAALDTYIENLQVEGGDIEAALPFVCYSKFHIAEPWVLKHHHGNRHSALRFVMGQLKTKFEQGFLDPSLENIQHLLAGEGTDAELAAIQRYCDSENPWLWKVLSPYRKKEEPTGAMKEHILNLYE